MEIKREIEKAIADLVIEVAREPMVYFSEADVQQMLAEKLRKILPKLYPTSVKKGKDSKSVYLTSQIHREYGAGEKARYDIVIFDKESIGRIDDMNLTIKGEYLRPLFAFELGTEKTSDAKTHFENDARKLRNCIDTGYLIHIYKDVTKARTGSKSRELTENKIKEKFKRVFSEAETAPKIKVVAVLLRGYRNQKKMRGKCEILIDGEWKKVNVRGTGEVLKRRDL